MNKTSFFVPSDGFGNLTYKNGDFYSGHFKSGKRWGTGKMIYNSTESSYDGDWVNDLREGEGKYEKTFLL